jgi:hypothetical protein
MMGGCFIVTIPIRLILYISYIAPIVSPPQPSIGSVIFKGFIKGYMHTKMHISVRFAEIFANNTSMQPPR